jgi:hypothetical protein
MLKRNELNAFAECFKNVRVLHAFAILSERHEVHFMIGCKCSQKMERALKCAAI